MENLINLFDHYVKLDENEIRFLQENIKLRSVPKNQVLLKEGEISTEFYFVIKGCLRLYYLSDAEEKTAYFYFENSFASSYQSFTKQAPAKHNIATVEDTELVVFDIDDVVKYTSFSPKFDLIARIIMEEELGIYQDIISSFVTKNAEERYKSLMNDQPEILQRIPQHHIATYLGVTAETLSRIRKRIQQK